MALLILGPLAALLAAVLLVVRIGWNACGSIDGGRAPCPDFVPGSRVEVDATGDGDADAREVVPKESVQRASRPTHLLGIVVGLPDRVPVEGARIEIRAGGEGSANTATDAHGRFRISRTECADWTLEAQADGFFPGELSSADVERALANARQVEVVLAPAGSLEVSVVDAGDAPVRAAFVRALPSAESWRGRDLPRLWPVFSEPGGPLSAPESALAIPAGTDAAGHVTLAPLPCGLPLDVSARFGGREVVRTVSIDPVSRVARVELRGPSGRTLRGSLVWADGEPAQGLRVDLLGRNHGYETGSFVAASHDGSFAFQHVEPGTYFVRPFGGGRLSFEAVLADADLDLGRLVLERDVEWKGRVVDTRSLEPVSGCSVVLWRENVIARSFVPDSEGRFSGLVQPGEYVAQVVSRSFVGRRVLARQAVRVPSAEAVLDVACGAARLSATFEGLGSEREVELVVVAPSCLREPLDSVEPCELAVARTDGHGHVEFGALPPGAWSALLRVEGTGSAWIPHLALEPGRALDLGSVAWGRGGLAGRESAAAGGDRAPTARRVLARSLAGDERWTALDEAERFRFDDLDFGPWFLACEPFGGSGDELRCAIVGTGEATIELESGLRGSIAGRVSCGGAPMEGARVEIAASAGWPRLQPSQERRTLTGGDGAYALGGLVPGRYTLRCRTPEFAPELEREVIVGAGARVEVAFDLPPAPVRLSFFRDGTKIRDLVRARASSTVLGSTSFSSGDCRDLGDVLVWLGIGDALVTIAPTASAFLHGSDSADGCFVARVGPGRTTAGDAVAIDLASDDRLRVVLDDAAREWPMPALYLASVAGVRPAPLFAQRVQAASEVVAPGEIVFPCLPDAVVCVLEGHDLDGHVHRLELVYRAPGELLVAWPPRSGAATRTAIAR